MKKQKQMIEIFLYIILIAIGTYFVLTDKEITFINDSETVETTSEETQNIIPEELITEDYEFGGTN